MAAANTTTNGYLTSTDWNTFNGKQAALVSGTNIKTVNSTSLLGAGDVSVGVTSVSGTGTVNGITLTGTVTSTGSLTLGGTLGGIANSQLTNSSITINGSAISLGGSVTVAPQAAISNDTATATAVYPLFAAATTGTPTTIYTSNSNYLYTPSTGELKAKSHNSTNGVTINADSVSSNMTIATGTNGFSVGPLTINSGVTLTVSSGQRHVII
jgi:hypothetical protein